MNPWPRRDVQALIKNEKLTLQYELHVQPDTLSQAGQVLRADWGSPKSRQDGTHFQMLSLQCLNLGLTASIYKNYNFKGLISSKHYLGANQNPKKLHILLSYNPSK